MFFFIKAATTKKWPSFVEDLFWPLKELIEEKTGSKCLRLLREEQKALICGKGGGFLHHHELTLVHSACGRKILLLTSYQTE